MTHPCFISFTDYLEIYSLTRQSNHLTFQSFEDKLLNILDSRSDKAM